MYGNDTYVKKPDCIAVTEILYAIKVNGNTLSHMILVQRAPSEPL